VESIKLFLCGDVMTGRGIDQIMASPCDPAIHEGYLKNALDYVELAECRNGSIPRRVDASYIWGDSLTELARCAPDARVVNLETAVTRSEDWLPKGINYRMSPANIGCLAAAALDCCVLSNNHVLDWGEAGLVETLATLDGIGVRTAGAGRSRSAAEAPAVIPLAGKGRILVYSVGTESSGVPPDWAAGETRPGVDFLGDLSPRSVARLARRIEGVKRPGDVVAFSIHWGGNWGYEIAPDEIRFARTLIDSAAVDLVYGHSSHHPKAIEVYRNKLILYGCGDFINDYEGIRGHEEFRSDLGLMYLPTLEAGTGRLLRLDLIATQILRLQVRHAPADDARWLCATLTREGRRFGTYGNLLPDGRIELQWERD
jgi:poly-gamma-glutamate synthesis protein (capsule biosynthesis protein)